MFATSVPRLVIPANCAIAFVRSCRSAAIAARSSSAAILVDIRSTCAWMPRITSQSNGSSLFVTVVRSRETPLSTLLIESSPPPIDVVFTSTFVSMFVTRVMSAPRSVMSIVCISAQMSSTWSFRFVMSLMTASELLKFAIEAAMASRPSSASSVTTTLDMSVPSLPRSTVCISSHTSCIWPDMFVIALICSSALLRPAICAAISSSPSSVVSRLVVICTFCSSIAQSIGSNSVPSASIVGARFVSAEICVSELLSSPIASAISPSSLNPTRMLVVSVTAFSISTKLMRSSLFVSIWRLRSMPCDASTALVRACTSPRIPSTSPQSAPARSFVSTETSALMSRTSCQSTPSRAFVRSEIISARFVTAWMLPTEFVSNATCSAMLLMSLKVANWFVNCDTANWMKLKSPVESAESCNSRMSSCGRTSFVIASVARDMCCNCDSIVSSCVPASANINGSA